VPWSSQQRTRVAVLEVDHVPAQAVQTFDRIRRHLPARRVATKASKAERSDGTAGQAAGESWVDVPQIPEFAAENLIRGQPWWLGFGDFVADKESRTHVFNWERKGLNRMVEDQEVTPHGPERAFVRACHVAWRRRLGALWQRATDQRLDFGRLAEQEFEKTRIAFTRCKTAVDFRRTVTDFWARGGSQPELREHWTAVLPFLTDQRKWSMGRDLALLALASYASEGADTTRPTEPTGMPTGPSTGDNT
jgi:CRISPR-associated protein Cas8a1/Csx13